MSNKYVRYILVFILIVLLKILFFSLYNFINNYSTDYIESPNNKIVINNIEDELYTTKLSSKYYNKTFYIHSNNKEEISILFNNLAYHHKIYLNEKLICQNVSVRLNNYMTDYAYLAYEIRETDYINNSIEIKVIGHGVDNTDIFLAKDNVLKYELQIRTYLHVVFMMFVIFSTAISFILYFRNRNKNFHFLIFGIMGIVLGFKALLPGDLPILSNLLGINVDNYFILEKYTNVIIRVFPLFIIKYIFDFKLKRLYVTILFIAYLIISFLVIDGTKHSYSTNILLVFITTIATILLMVNAIVKKKPYSRIITVGTTIYSAFIYVYISMLSNQMPTGVLPFYINPGYVGAVTFRLIFLISILHRHLIKVRSLERNKQLYEKSLLLQGVSHDLKHPLSIIKLNNQIIEEYDLTKEELKQSTQASLEATDELEKMITDINSYLNIRDIYDKDGITSVKDCFKDIDNYLNLYSNYKDYELNIEVDEEDCTLDIAPIYFKRMLYNLIDNAFKYNQGDVEINLSYKIEKKLIILIEDNGIGMDESELKNIFVPFYQIENNRTEAGFGLGLCIVKEIVDKLDGTIDVNSQKSVGTNILITIPIKK